jgi:hypothetical protein
VDDQEPVGRDGDDDAFDLGDADPDAWLWVRGVDCTRGWREAKNAADALNGTLRRLGVGEGEVRAVARTHADGRGVVRVHGSPEGVRRLTGLLALLDGCNRR